MKKFAALMGVIALGITLSLPVSAAEKASSTKVTGVQKKLAAFEFKISDNERSVAMKVNGEFRVSGVKVNSVDTAANTVNVTFYGFTRNVNVSGANFIGGGKDITLADVKAGDILNAVGKYDETTRTITVSQIHDVSFNSSSAADTSKIQAKIQELLKMVEALKAKLAGH